MCAGCFCSLLFSCTWQVLWRVLSGRIVILYTWQFWLMLLVSLLGPRTTRGPFSMQGATTWNTDQSSKARSWPQQLVLKKIWRAFIYVLVVITCYWIALWPRLVRATTIHVLVGIVDPSLLFVNESHSNSNGRASSSSRGSPRVWTNPLYCIDSSKNLKSYSRNNTSLSLDSLLIEVKNLPLFEDCNVPVE